MQHKTLETKTTQTTDLGEFTAIAAAYSVDRVGERIVPGAFAASIKRWQESNKQIPLHWDHQGDAASIIGTIEPKSMRETAEGLEVGGKLDLDESEIAREAWRSMKANRVALSFGYMVQDSDIGDDDVRALKTLDLFEVSITPAPANPDTRFIDLKGLVPDAIVVKRSDWPTVLANAASATNTTDTIGNAIRVIEQTKLSDEQADRLTAVIEAQKNVSPPAEDGKGAVNEGGSPPDSGAPDREADEAIARVLDSLT